MESKIYVTIPDTKAIHVHRDVENEIGHGDLTLVRLTKHTLGITVGKAAFALDRATPFGTIDDNTYTYLFSPSGVPGHVKLILPDSSSFPNLSTLQDTFEHILIRFGLLKSGLSAYTDELARSAEESSLSASSNLLSFTEAYISGHPATTDPVSIDSSLHDTVDAAALQLSGAAETTGAAAKYVGSHVQAGGAWIAQQANGSRPQVARASTSISSLSSEGPGAPLTLRTVAAEYTTISSSLSSSFSALSSAAGSSATRIVGHDFGPEAAKLTDGIMRGAIGAGRVVKDLGKATSVGWFAGRGVMGALDVKDPRVAAEVRSEGRGMEVKAREVVEV